MHALTSDIAELRSDMQTLAARVDELNRRVFATTPPPPTPAVPRALVAPRSVSHAIPAPAGGRARHRATHSHAAKVRLVRHVRGAVLRHAGHHREEDEEEEEETVGAETD